jgi:hypothetical protein
MGKFLESEKLHQTRFKAHSPYFSDAARADGVYKGKQRPYCLPVEHATENLYPQIRDTARAYFSHYEIKWHDGQNSYPSHHLCDSQVCCVNFLFPFADKPEELAQLLRPIYPTIGRMLPIENGQYVAFEWIGLEDHLCEMLYRRGKRARGALSTSADATVMFEQQDGKRQIVLIEWKYTESYSSSLKIMSKSGTDRRTIYKHLYEDADCPLNKNLLPAYDALFHDPFDQLMRQQFLAHEIERKQELGADIVTVLHIAPAQNTDFYRITSPKLVLLGETTAMATWKKLVLPDKFVSISTEQLFGNLSAQQMPRLVTWLEYITARYAWVTKAGGTTAL